VKKCEETCAYLRSFRYGFDGVSKLLAPFDRREKLATCVLKTNLVLHMRAHPMCWRKTNI